MPSPQPPAFDLERIGSGLIFSSVLPRLTAALAAGPGAAVVVQAPPGTGKTTLVPPAVADRVAGAAHAGGAHTGIGRVVVTQPRRVAVRAAARRLAHLDGSALGTRVGYAVRGERRSGADTLVEFVTPGLLLRRLLADPGLEGVAAVVVDEVHERNLDTDLLLGLLSEVRALREDLTLVAMSATLDAPRFAALLGDGSPAPLVDSPAALHPLTVRWSPAPVPRQDERGVTPGFLDDVAATTLAAHGEALAAEPGTDALVFLPGVREVDAVVRRLRERLGRPERGDARLGEVDVLPLHGGVGSAEQDRAVAGRNAGDPPRIIVSTSLAESSLTVPGVRLVVDAGLAREPRRDAARGMQGLVTVPVSRAAAEQRSGRAARLGPGTVVRCYDERTLAAASAHPTPEVRTADLTQAALTLAAWGTPRGRGLRLPEDPPAAALDDAEATLASLGAVDMDGRATAVGERLAALPLHPRWGRALLDAAGRVGAHVAARAVAVATADVRADGGDLTRVQAGADVRREAERLLRLLPGRGGAARADAGGGRGVDADGGGWREALGLVTALAWPERVAHRVGEGTYLLASGTRAGLPAGTLRGSEWLAVAEVTRAAGRDAAGTGAVIRSAAPVGEAEALEAAGPLRTDRVEARWEAGRVSARRVRRVGAIELSSTPVRASREEGRAAVVAALRELGLGVLRPSEAARGLRRRLGFLHRVLGEPWPDMAEPALLAAADTWLGPELERLAAGASVGSIDVADALRRLLPWPQAGRFDELAPARLRVPSGNTAAVTYPEVDEAGPPVVAVKLQECFGWEITPRLADGRVPVLFHLLSPAGRPLAVTDDLAGFWAGAYAQVRAEMRGRYPKHPWPEDPTTAQATHLTTRRLRER